MAGECHPARHRSRRAAAASTGVERSHARTRRFLWHGLDDAGREADVRLPFTKMHGIGNDYVYVDAFANPVADPARAARLVSPRTTAIGSDGLILICPSDVADVRMERYNADCSR